MTFRFGLLILVATIALGCNHQRKEQRRVAQMVGNLEVRVPPGGDAALIFSAVRAHLTRFEQDFGAHSAHAVVTVTLDDYVYRNGQAYWGWYEYPDQIEVIAGHKSAVPVLYHELWHLNLPTHDYNHSDPRWPSWNATSAQIAASLVSER